MPGNRKTMIVYGLVVAFLIVAPLIAVNALSIVSFNAGSYEVIEGILKVVPFLCFILVLGTAVLDVLDYMLSRELASRGLKVKQPKTGVEIDYREKYPRSIICMYALSVLSFIITLINSRVFIESVKIDDAAGVILTNHGTPEVGFLVFLISLFLEAAIIISVTRFNRAWSKLISWDAFTSTEQTDDLEAWQEKS